MEDKTEGKQPSRRWSVRKILTNIAILFLPVLFVLAVSVIMPLAATLGLFYARVEMSLLITVILFSVTWIYLSMRTSNPKAAKMLARSVTFVALILLTISTTLETVSVAPLVAIEKEFTAPDGWTKQTAGNGTRLVPGAGLLGCIGLISVPSCPEIKSTWEKEQQGTALTLEDLERLATANDYIGFNVVSDECGKSTSSATDSCALEGKVQGQNVSLGYYGSYDHWEIRLRLYK